MNHPDPYSSNVPRQIRPSRRPATISELAERANTQWDESKGFKYHLKLAERYRREGKEHARAGDMENAFVQLAKAATLVLERLPEHPDYNAKLNATQRHNLGLVRSFISKKPIHKLLKSKLENFMSIVGCSNPTFLSTEWPRDP